MTFLFFMSYAIFAATLLVGMHRFERARNSIRHRVAVLSDDADDTTVRVTAAIMHNSGLHTYAKTSGDTVRVILPGGQPATLKSASKLLPRATWQLLWSFARRGADAAIIESKSLGALSRIAAKLFRPRTTIIPVVSNGRRVTEGDIRRTYKLLRSVPSNSTLVTAEQRRGILSIMRRESKLRSITLVEAATNPRLKATSSPLRNVVTKRATAIALALTNIFATPDAQTAEAVHAAVNASQRPSTATLQFDCKQRISTGLQVLIRKVDETARAVTPPQASATTPDR